MGETLEEARPYVTFAGSEAVAAVNFQLRYAPNNLGHARIKPGCSEICTIWKYKFEPTHRGNLDLSCNRAAAGDPLSQHPLPRSHPLLARQPLGVYAKTVRNPQTGTLAATKTTIILDYGEWKRVFVVTNHGHDSPAESHRSFVQWEGTEARCAWTWA